ncbi:tetratricopeptide repeat protein [Halalkalibacillus halophilus]|uniref:tetratricopeptide repeat protein n=1 Tax=Halalkalibacillus halophilus TaxID=392827 RepID=UPI0004282049|nr:tetratricopeptide repeat protein [Halalkalibacillus halophilus]
MHTTMSQTNQLTQLNNVADFRHDGDFYFTYGVKAFKRKKFQRAEQWFHKAIEFAPANVLFKCQLSVLYTEIKQYHQANDLLQQVLEIGDETYADCYYLLANNYAHLGLFYEAKKYSDLYLEQEPEGDFAEETQNLLMMVNQVLLDDFDEDELEFDEEDEFLIYQETAFYHLEREEWDEALEVLNELMSLFPEYFPAKHEYAYALFQSGNKEEAIALEEEWFEQDRLSLHSRLNLALFYKQARTDETPDHMKNSLMNIYPTSVEKRLKVAVTLAQIGAYEEALIRFQQLRKSALTDYLSYYVWYGVALKQTGIEVEASRLWEEGMRRHPKLKMIIQKYDF